MKRLLPIITLAIILVACSSPPPRHQLNVCKIFRQYHSWYWDAQTTQRRWGIPISVQMAIIHQESHFRDSAEPPHKKILGFVLWLRPTTAEGYAQALDATWRLYLRDTHQRSARRSDFAKATDFIGWYANVFHREAKIPRRNAFALYLAFHEGIKGYQQNIYLRKPWLIKVAHHVQEVADIYHHQLIQCQSGLPKKPWWRFWN